MIIESKITGLRNVFPNTDVDLTDHEVCGYGPTRQYCLAALFLLKPSKYRFDPKDAYDNVISHGRRVAYNYQGEVRIGHVVGVENTKRNGKLVNTRTKEPHLVISIRQACGTVSKVSNRKNLVVID